MDLAKQLGMYLVLILAFLHAPPWSFRIAIGAFFVFMYFMHALTLYGLFLGWLVRGSHAFGTVVMSTNLSAHLQLSFFAPHRFLLVIAISIIRGLLLICQASVTLIRFRGIVALGMAVLCPLPCCAMNSEAAEVFLLNGPRALQFLMWCGLVVLPTCPVGHDPQHMSVEACRIKCRKFLGY